MFISHKEIQNFYSKINISPNIIHNILSSFNKTSKNNSAIRINYIINQKDEIILHNQDERIDKYYSFIFYEIFIIKLDFIRNTSKMIMIYNNENKEYNIKIWVSKLEKLEIKDEYNKIVKTMCSKKNINNILKNILKLRPDKYTIYYFPSNISLFEKELAFIYIFIVTQNDKSKFQNFRQVKDLISNAKSYLIPKINEFLFKYENENENEKVNGNEGYKCQKNKDIFKLIFSDNKENILIDNILKNNNIISPKNTKITINFNSERFNKIMNKNKKNIMKKSIDHMKKPYNKILFNYSFEKNSKDKNIKIKNQRKSFIEPRKKANDAFINSYKSKVENKYFNNFPLNIYTKIKDINTTHTPVNNDLSFSLSSKNNYSLPYEKKRPSSIPKKIMEDMSNNIYNIKYQFAKKDFINDNSSTNKFCIYKKNKSYKNKTMLYKKKAFSKKNSEKRFYLNSIYYFNNKNSKNDFNISNSTYNNKDNEAFFNKVNYSITTNKYRKSNYNDTMKSFNYATSTFDISDNNEENNISNITINKKAIINIKCNNFHRKTSKNNQINKFYINNGNKTSRNMINERIRKKLISYKQGINNFGKKALNKTRENEMQKMSENEEEISLFL